MVADNISGETQIKGLRWEPGLANNCGGFVSLTKTINELLELDVEREAGVYVFFMPTIGEGLENNKTLNSKLSDKFFMPPFFFENTGWNANGFFGSFDTQSANDEGNCHVTYFRFLTKGIEISPADTIEYAWDFLGFSTISRFGTTGAVDLQIIFCFDLSPDAEQQFRTHLAKFEDRFKVDPFALIKVVAEFVTFRLEQFVWQVQPFVRRIEKSRRKYFYPDTVHDLSLKAHKNGLENVIGRYDMMHELARHMIHIMETLAVAVNTMTKIAADHKALCLDGSEFQTRNFGSSISRRVGCDLQFSITYIANLQERTKAFVDRIQNEIHLGFNMVAAVDSSITRTILDRANQGRDLADAVAFATFIFLPAALMSGFFGMNFFVLSPPSSAQQVNSTTLSVSSKIWIFFVASGMCTISLLVLFLLKINPVEWIRKSMDAFTGVVSRRPRVNSDNSRQA